MKQIELKEKRKLREKHFLQEDGTIVAKVYNADIHYFKNGKYEEIDNTIIKKDHKYVNKSNSFNVSFFNSLNGLIEAKVNRSKIKISLKDCLDVSPVSINTKFKMYSKVLYQDILNNIDIKYELESSKLKENIILKNRDAIENTIVFKVETDLLLKKENNRIIAYNSNKKEFEFDSLYMIDKNNKISTEINYELSKKDNHYELSLNADKNWLNDNERVFPIIIDPTITNITGDNNVYDTYISEASPNTNMGGQDKLKVGVERINNVDYKNRTLLKFELPTLGTADQVIEAYVELQGYPINNTNFSSQIVNVYRLTSNWSENNATWQNMSQNYSANRVENCFLSHRSINSGGNLIYLNSVFNITNLVKKWYTDTPNYGIMLKLNKEEYDNKEMSIFYSKNNLEDEELKPFLTVVYRTNNGIEENIKYCSKELSNGDLHVNLFNGNLTGEFDLLSVKKSTFPIELSIIYNTNDVILNNNYGYGLGYKFNYHQLLNEISIDEQDYIQYIDDDGAIHYFEVNGDIMEDEGGLNLVLVYSNNQYIISNDGEYKLLFTQHTDGIWYLSEITDRNNNKIYVGYDNSNRIISLTDSENNSINISYLSNEILIRSIDETVVITLTNNKMANIESTSGITSFAYSNDFLQTIVDENGLTYTLSYYNNSPHRISKIQEIGRNNGLGNSTEFFYNNNVTKMEDENGFIEVTTFNSFGSAISLLNLEEDGKIIGAYGKKEIYNNNDSKQQIVSEQQPQKHVNNYFMNGSISSNLVVFDSNDANITITNEDCYTGDKCLKIVNNSADEESVCTEFVPTNNYYTFSCYMKNSNNVKISLSYFNENNEEVITYSDIILPKSNFEREKITIFFPDDIYDYTGLNIKIISLESGVTYLDDLQLEEGNIANSFNFIENSNFYRGLGGWTLSLTEHYGESNENYNPDDFFEIIYLDDNQKALKVNMNPSVSTGIEQTFSIKGEENELYTISFWYKNEGVTPQTGLQNCVAFLQFIYDDEVPGHGIEVEQLNCDCDSWQFFTDTFVSEASFSGITLKINQELNANQFTITNISVIKDMRSVNYNYDNKGNIVSIKNLENEQIGFSYNANNDLVSMNNFRGDNFNIEYDNINSSNIINILSGENISNLIAYNQNNEAVSLKTVNYKNDSISENDYKIRVRGTNSYLNISNSNLIFINNSCCANKWEFVLEGAYYRIRSKIIANKYISIIGESVKLTGQLDDSSLFNIEITNNNSYRINLYNTNMYLMYYNNKLEVSEYQMDNPYFEFIFECNEFDKFFENNYEYSNGIITKYEDANLNHINYYINSNTGLIDYFDDTIGIRTNYFYNNKRLLTKIKRNDKEIQYNYDNYNNVTKVRTNLIDYFINYDEFNNISSVNVNNAITLIKNYYGQKNGNLIRSEYGNGDTIYYEYDRFGRIKKMIKNNKTFNYYYGNNGDLIKIDSDKSSTEFSYDATKRLVQFQNGDLKIKYSYDNYNNICKKEYYCNNLYEEISYNYDLDNSISEIIIGNNNIKYFYDKIGRLTNKDVNNIACERFEYINNGKRTTDLVSKLSIGNNIYKYKYDKNSNITDIYKNNSHINRFIYDSDNQLISDIDYSRNLKTKITYDINGNIMSKKGTKLNDYNIITMDSYNYSNDLWKDQITDFNDISISYDEIGNPIIIGNASLQWKNGRELSKYMDNLNSIEYDYNINGNRIYKKANNQITNYYLEDDEIVFEETNGNTLFFIRNDDGELEALKYNNSVYYYIKNELNDIIGLMDENGVIVVNYSYDSFGNIISIKNENDIEINSFNHIGYLNPYRYRSYYYDKETGFYYLNNRYYNPKWGRFINADAYLSTGDSINGNNMYSYCENNFINYIDAEGLKKTKKSNKQKKALKLSIYMYSLAHFHSFKKKKFDSSSLLSQRLKKSCVTKSIFNKYVKQMKKQKLTYNQYKSSASYYDKSTAADYDLSYSVGKADYIMTIKRESKKVKVGKKTKTKVRYVATVVVSDKYNFDEWRKEITMSNLANNFGLVGQRTGYLKPYSWEASFKLYSKWQFL